MAARTEIFSFLDVGAWLRAEFEARKAETPSLTHRTFSAQCGYKSSGGVSLLMSGRRRMSRDAAARIGKALDLTLSEREHLRRMVEFSLADDFEERANILRSMTAAKRFAEDWKGTVEAFEFYRDWTAPVVRELVSLPDFKEDPEWIAARVHKKIRTREARSALARLLRTGYLERDKDGALRPSAPIIATKSELQSEPLKNFHREMMKLAGEALDTQGRDQRDMRVITMAISESQAARLKAMLTQFHKEVLEVVAEDEPIETVYQLNTQLFALTDPPDAPAHMETVHAEEEA